MRDVLPQQSKFKGTLAEREINAPIRVSFQSKTIVNCIFRLSQMSQPKCNAAQEIGKIDKKQNIIFQFSPLL